MNVIQNSSEFVVSCVTNMQRAVTLQAGEELERSVIVSHIVQTVCWQYDNVTLGTFARQGSDALMVAVAPINTLCVAQTTNAPSLVALLTRTVQQVSTVIHLELGNLAAVQSLFVLTDVMDWNHVELRDHCHVQRIMNAKMELAASSCSLFVEAVKLVMAFA